MPYSRMEAEDLAQETLLAMIGVLECYRKRPGALFRGFVSGLRALTALVNAHSRLRAWAPGPQPRVEISLDPRGICPWLCRKGGGYARSIDQASPLRGPSSTVVK